MLPNWEQTPHIISLIKFKIAAIGMAIRPLRLSKPKIGQQALMRIFLVSDLHVEFHKSYPLPETYVDLVVLAGDIHVGNQVIDVVKRYREHCGVPVIFIAGNHEFYGCDYHKQLAVLRAAAAEIDQVYFLENDSVEIAGVRFLGCVLWTDFTLHGDQMIQLAKSSAEQFIADFQMIRLDKRRFTSDHAISLFEKSYWWLESQLAQTFQGKTVVITHFLPHRQGIHSMYTACGPDQLTPYFTIDCSSLMKHYQIDAWFYGHTHNSLDIVVENGTRLVSNQRGYPSERWSYTRFDPQKIIEI